MKQEFYYPSKDGRTKIHAIEWIPKGEVTAVLQICHGMVEYIDRYDEFARFLNENGYYVVGHDHLGHGQSVVSEDKLGFFHESKGNACVIGDIHYLRKFTQKKYPDVPYFMLGHSMGSFLLRQYIGLYGNGLAGAIVMGTGSKSDFILAVGKLVCRISAFVKGWEYRSNLVNSMAFGGFAGAIVMGTGSKSDFILAVGKLVCRISAFVKGWEYRSNLVNSMAFGGFNKKFAHETTGSNWLSRNPVNAQNYAKDPLCNFVFTVNAYYQMFCGIQAVNRQERNEEVPKTLPIFFVAGREDPVGNFGKSVENIYKNYKSCGIQDVSIKLYEKDRHEILNEVDRRIVFEDLLRWMEKRKNR